MAELMDHWCFLYCIESRLGEWSPEARVAAYCFTWNEM